MKSGFSDQNSADQSPQSNENTKGAKPSRQGHERRVTLQALKIWNKIPKHDNIPDLSGLCLVGDGENSQFILAENQFLIMVDDNPLNSVIIFYGSDLPNQPAYRDADSNLQLSLPASLRSLFQDACREAVESLEVVYRQGKISTKSDVGVLFRSIFLPLRSGHNPERCYVFGSFSNDVGGGDSLAAV